MIVVSIIPKGSVHEKLLSKIGPEYFNMISQGVLKAAVMVRDTWRDMIDESTSPQGWKKAYKQSVGFKKDGAFTATVEPQGKGLMFANFVEFGVKKFDMRPGLANGPHSRINSAGERYNIVYIRKGTPGSQRMMNMPESLYADIKGTPDNKKMMVKGVGGRMQFANKKINLNEKIYSKGYQRFNYSPAQEKEEKKNIFKGMVKGGASGHSQYGSFHVVKLNSKGWQYPGVDPSPVFNKMARKMVPIVENILRVRLNDDLENMRNSIREGQK